MRKQRKMEYEVPTLVELELKLGGEMLVVSIPGYTDDGSETLGDDTDPTNPSTNSFIY